MIRLGLIGAGRWGKIHLQSLLALQNRCRVTHVATSKPETAALLPYPVAIEADWRRVLDAGCDAVIIATPSHTHAQISEACLDRRLPCLVEKPWCTDAETARRLHDKAAASGSPILIGHTVLFHPAYQAFKRRVHEGGEQVKAVLAERMGTDRPPVDTPVVWEWGPHDVAVCLDLFGQYPERIEALPGLAQPANGPAMAMLRLEFSGGICAWIQIGWLAPEKRRRVSFLTDRHAYVLDDLAAHKLTAGAPGTAERTPVPLDDPRAPITVMQGYFLDGLAGGDRRLFGTRLALEVTRVLAECDAALKASPLVPQRERA